MATVFFEEQLGKPAFPGRRLHLRSDWRSLCNHLLILLGMMTCVSLQARAQFAKTIYPVPFVPINAVTTWYYASCESLTTGTYTVTIPPTHGQATESFADLPIPGCDTGPQAATVEDYEWTDTNPEDKTDYFQLLYQADGQSETIDITVQLSSDVILSIAGPSGLWWFNGETPPNYATEIELTVTPAGYGPYTWIATDTAGTGQVVFPNGSSVYETVSNTVIVSSAHASSPKNDVNISVASALGGSPQYPITVYAPKSLTPVNILQSDFVSLRWGYDSFIAYSIRDQFGNLLPAPVPLNEQWESPLINDYPGTNWTRGLACGKDQVCGTFSPQLWTDMIQGQCEVPFLCPTPIPRPIWPLFDRFLTDVPVDHWQGEWLIGSGIPGRGVGVQTNIWQKYQDHARHTDIVSPLP